MAFDRDELIDIYCLMLGVEPKWQQEATRVNRDFDPREFDDRTLDSLRPYQLPPRKHYGECEWECDYHQKINGVVKITWDAQAYWRDNIYCGCMMPLHERRLRILNNIDEFNFDDL